jgi:hypothetical protein
MREGVGLYFGIVDNSTSEEREIVNLTSLYEFMMEKDYEDLPDTTTEKHCLIYVSNKLNELGVKVKKPKSVATPAFPGNFENV